MDTHIMRVGDIVNVKGRKGSFRVTRKIKTSAVLYGPLNNTRARRFACKSDKVTVEHSYPGISYKIVKETSINKLRRMSKLQVREFDNIVFVIDGVLTENTPSIVTLSEAPGSMWNPIFYDSMEDCKDYYGCNILILDVQHLWNQILKPETTAYSIPKAILMDNQFIGKLCPETWFDIQVTLRSIARLGIKNIKIIIKRLDVPVDAKRWRMLYSNLRQIPEFRYFKVNNIFIPRELNKITYNTGGVLAELEKLEFSL